MFPIFHRARAIAAFGSYAGAKLRSRIEPQRRPYCSDPTDSDGTFAAVLKSQLLRESVKSCIGTLDR